MRLHTLLSLFPFLLFFAGCPFFGGPFSDASDDSITHLERDVSGKLAVALEGNAEGTDEIVLEESLQLLDLRNEDPDLFSLEVRDGFVTYTEGKGAKVIPQRVGVGYVTPIVSGRTRDPIQITIPPQKLIQVLIGEARGELDREATTEDDQVKESSVSVTGDALGAVIRNRINLINDTGNPDLFLADPEAYESDPPVSYYEAVIEANDGDNYQFLPVDPDDPSFPYYDAAAHRIELGETLLTAYDQAVLTAADIFNEDTEDPTGGAFGFYSPSESEYEVLQDALEGATLEMPGGAGVSDTSFPALAPIQVLLLEGIAPSADDDDIPSFVFVRSRNALDPAVTDGP